MSFGQVNEDNADYFRFTGRARFDKAVHTLEGLLDGISADGAVSGTELRALAGWIAEHAEFADRHPFREIVYRLHEALTDGVFDPEERADVLWLCNRFTTDETYFDAVTSDLQRLHGMLGGIVADGSISKSELESLGNWLDEHQHLKSLYPFDEIEGVITHVLRDGKIDKHEHEELLRFFVEFLSHAGHRTLELPISDESNFVSGVCALCPDIVFAERHFCFTGRSERFSRSQLVDLIVDLGGRFSKDVTQDLDYLIIGAEGNECWAYACYGRKVEKAVKYRRDGHRMLIVHEHDFWDSVEDARST